MFKQYLCNRINARSICFITYGKYHNKWSNPVSFFFVFERNIVLKMEIKCFFVACVNLMSLKLNVDYKATTMF